MVLLFLNILYTMKNLLSVLGYLLGITLLLITTISIGAFIATAAILGFFSALGVVLVALRSCLLMRFLLWISLYIDVLIFVGGILATITLGVTVAASLVFTGVFFSLIMKVVEKFSLMSSFRVKYKLDSPLFVFPRFRRWGQ